VSLPNCRNVQKSEKSIIFEYKYLKIKILLLTKTNKIIVCFVWIFAKKLKKINIFTIFAEDGNLLHLRVLYF